MYRLPFQNFWFKTLLITFLCSPSEQFPLPFTVLLNWIEDRTLATDVWSCQMNNPEQTVRCLPQHRVSPFVFNTNIQLDAIQLEPKP